MTTSAVTSRAADPTHFRHTLGHFPTGVVVITAAQPDGEPVGMAVGSFTSVSLDPPLVAFLPAKTSTSWPKIERAGQFCVNILTAEQEQICRRLSSTDADKFSGLEWSPAASGAPVFGGVAAWIDCDIQDVVDAGDHYIVLGRVRDLDVAEPALPLVFYRGGYGRFAPGPLVLADNALIEHLPLVDVARPYMDALSNETGVPSLASVRSGDEVILAASAGGSTTREVPSWVGTRFPAVAPLANVFLAWSDAATVEAALRELPAELRDVEAAALERIRRRGYSVIGGGDALATVAATVDELAAASLRTDPEHRLEHSVPQMLRDFEPEELGTVAALGAPVFGPDGGVALLLNLYPVPSGLQGGVERLAEQLVATADAITARARLVL